VRVATPFYGEPALKVLVMSGLLPSNSEARRQVQQGAVEVDGARVTDPNQPLQAGREYLIRVGKRRFKRVFLDRTE
jgi:tyrosyl-tRNA synthetase